MILYTQVLAGIAWSCYKCWYLLHDGITPLSSTIKFHCLSLSRHVVCLEGRQMQSTYSVKPARHTATALHLAKECHRWYDLFWHGTASGRRCSWELILLEAIKNNNDIFDTPRKWRFSELKTKIKSKLEWLRVDVILNWESLVKEDWIKPLNEDTDPLE